MFAIIISEKGGAERRESFDKNEINVGRVQGNDLMLPKGNVSKHHARLLFRDGRFIVTDLKSTNGTYVNGRKIAQATIVREGDKIYIGDFVLRLEAAGQVPAVGDMAPVEEESIRTLARDQARPVPNPPAVTLKAPTHPPGAAPLPRPPTQAPTRVEPPQPPPPPQNFAIERDPDDSEPLQKRQASALPPPIENAPRVSAPTPPPPNARPHTMPLQQMTRASMPALPMPLPQPAPQPLPTTASAPALAPPPQQVGRVTSAPPARPAPPKEQAGRRLALQMLLDRVADSVDLSPLRATPIVNEMLGQQLERAAREQATAMREEGEAPEGIDLEQLVRDAHRELTQLGAVGPLLEDEDVSEIHVLRFDQVLVVRAGQITHAEAAFSSDEALYRVIARLAAQSGDPWRPGELVLERRHPRGHMVAVIPPVAASHVLYIRKKRRVEASLEDFVRNSVMSRPMAVFLEGCVGGRANIFVCGAPGSGTNTMLAAIASASAPGERIAAVQEVEELSVSHAHIVALALLDTRARGEEAVRAAARLQPDRLFVSHATGAVAAAALDAIGDGCEGVVCASPASTLRQGLSRMVSHLAVARPGLSLEAARDIVGESFDIAIEMGIAVDGRQRIVRIAELNGSDPKGIVTRDIFTYAGEGGEGGFSATGIVPKISQDLAARGTRLDPGLFKRR